MFIEVVLRRAQRRRVQMVPRIPKTRCVRVISGSEPNRPLSVVLLMNNTHTTSLLIATALLHACSNTQASMTEPEVDAAPDAAIAGQTDAPTYDELFNEYFAEGKPGHCATAGCHADPGHNVWLCPDKDT